MNTTITLPPPTKRPSLSMAKPSRPSLAAPKPVATVGIDRIRTRAYEIYEVRVRGNAAGDSLSDWLQAEQELIGSAAGDVPCVQGKARSQVRGEGLLAGEK